MGSLHTQYIPYEKHLMSRNPSLTFLGDMSLLLVFFDTPGVDSRVKQALVLVGRDTLVADAYSMKSGKQFVNT